MIIAILSYLLVFLILGFMGYTTTMLYAIPLTLLLLIFMVDKESFENNMLGVILGVGLSFTYLFTYFKLFHPESNPTLSPLNYVFLAFSSFMITIYMIDSKKLGIEVFDISMALVILVILTLFLSPFLLATYNSVAKETKMSWILSVKESVDEIYGSKANSFLEMLDNMRKALDPNTYMINPEEEEEEQSNGGMYNPSKDVEKDMDEGFSVHLLQDNTALFYSSMYPNFEKEITFKMENNKGVDWIFKYVAGYIFGNKFLLAGMTCVSPRNTHTAGKCITEEGKALAPETSDIRSIIIKTPSCNVKDKLYFFDRYISLSKSRKTIYLTTHEEEKTKSSSDPLSIVIYGAYLSSKKEVHITLIPYLSDKEGWIRKAYVPYIYVKIPSWLKPKDCDWSKWREDEGEDIYAIDVLNRGSMCIEGGRIGEEYRCTFTISKEGENKEFFDVTAIAPYLIKEFFPSPSDITIFSENYDTSCRGKVVDDMINLIKKYFDVEDENIDIGEEVMLQVDGAKLKGSLNDAIKSLADYCADLNTDSEISRKCFSISFTTPQKSSANVNEEINRGGEISRGDISIGDETYDEMLSSVYSSVNSKVKIRMRGDSIKEIKEGNSYRLDIEYTPGCDEDVVWVNIYE